MSNPWRYFENPSLRVDFPITATHIPNDSEDSCPAPELPDVLAI
jgi:hypothetical protein